VQFTLLAASLHISCAGLAVSPSHVKYAVFTAANLLLYRMQTIISKALTECDIKPVPSRRCFTVMCEYDMQRQRCRDPT
jgi:hypothetical protein